MHIVEKRKNNLVSLEKKIRQINLLYNSLRRIRVGFKEFLSKRSEITIHSVQMSEICPHLKNFS